ncbi:hypothetical protein WJX73_009984 [Symbiochloris irregularis]|uniref:Uncharacterized protein n=1 Tax=Symbiochloris irregularis TaxID=706552 RepID=A0AAW1PQM0_9CHLO
MILKPCPASYACGRPRALAAPTRFFSGQPLATKALGPAFGPLRANKASGTSRPGHHSAAATRTRASSSSSAVPSSDKSAPGFAGSTLLKKTYSLLRNNLCIVLSAFLLCDGLTWLLHRCSHRLTNQVAVQFLSDVPADAIGNLWWISNDTTIANFQTGYQYIVGAVFVLVFPISILLRTLATAVAILACHQNPGGQVGGAQGWRLSPAAVLAQLREQWGRVRERWFQLWEVECLLAARVIPLSGLSLLVLPLPWTLPRLMALSATSSQAILQGSPGNEALQRSQQRLRPFWRNIAWPYLALVLSARALEVVKVAAFGALPARLQRDLPELSIAIFVVLSLVTFMLCRMRDLLGLAAYQMTDDPAPGGPLPTKPATV